MVAGTSLSAWEKIKPKLSKRQQQVLGCMAAKAPTTRKELADFMDWPINRVTPRVRELIGKGVLEVTGTKNLDGFTHEVIDIR